MMIRVYQCVGMGFLLVPIQTLCYEGIPQEKNNNVSGMTNLARNLGGSLGISAISVIFSRRSQFHQSVSSRTSPEPAPFSRARGRNGALFRVAGTWIRSRRHSALTA